MSYLFSTARHTSVMAALSSGLGCEGLSSMRVSMSWQTRATLPSPKRALFPFNVWSARLTTTNGAVVSFAVATSCAHSL